MTLMELLELVPDHARIGLVLEHDGKQNTLFSGYNGDFLKFCNYRCIYPYDYKVTSVHAGSWDCKKGLVVGVKYNNEKK